MRLLTLSACLPGMLLTMLLLARGVTWLLQTHYAVTFHGILGIVAASTLVIVPIRYDSVGEADGVAALLRRRIPAGLFSGKSWTGPYPALESSPERA